MCLAAPRVSSLQVAQAVETPGLQAVEGMLGPALGIKPGRRAGHGLGGRRCGGQRRRRHGHAAHGCAAGFTVEVEPAPMIEGTAATGTAVAVAVALAVVGGQRLAVLGQCAEHALAAFDVGLALPGADRIDAEE